MKLGNRKRGETPAAEKKGRELRSPFDLTANLYAYVPREAVESCLGFTVRALRQGDSRVVLTGPAGIGKTLLLHMIGDRIGGELGVVYLPYAALPPDDLCTWALGRMERPHGKHPVAALTEHARELGEQGKALLMLLDDANTMSLTTARWLSELTRELDGAVRLVVAATDGAQVEGIIEALGPEVKRCRLDQPLTLEESKTYVTTRLELSKAPASTLMRFDDTTLHAIHRASGGNPRQIHQIASAVLRGLAPETLGFEAEYSVTSAEPSEAPNEAEATKGTAKSRKKRKKGAGLMRAGVDEVRVGIGHEELCAPEEPRASKLYGPRPEQPVEPVAAVGAAAEPEAQQRPRQAALAPPTPLRVFRSVGIIAAALVAMVLARPVVHLNPPAPEIVAAPRVVARISTELPALPAGVHKPIAPEKPAGSPKPVANGRRAGPLSVQVNATPWARVEVDGINFGETPISDIPLLPGAHTFRARMPDGRTLERVVEIDDSSRFVFFE